ncbi:MAG: glutathione S-transferase [Candidatus Azotimanducaceae bacterium]
MLLQKTQHQKVLPRRSVPETRKTSANQAAAKQPMAMGGVRIVKGQPSNKGGAKMTVDTLEVQVERLEARITQLGSAKASKPTLVYFDIIGICWPVRCLLHLKEIDYELIEISIRQWSWHDQQGRQVLKSCFRNGHIPLYVDEAVNLNQSNVIMMYLGEQHDLIGDNPVEKLMAMEVMAHAYDALFHFSGLFQTNIKIGVTEEVFTARLNAYMGKGAWGVLSNGYQNNLDAFQRYLDANTSDGGFIVGNRLSVADLHAFNVLCNWFKAFDPTRFVETYPRLNDYIHRIAAVPGVLDYIACKQEATVWFELPDIAHRLTTPKELDGLINSSR